MVAMAAAARADCAGNAGPTISSSKQYAHWRAQLARVRAMRDRDTHEMSKIIRRRAARLDEPSFSRLFTHEMWSYYVAPPPLIRWWRVLITWPQSTVLRAVLPLVLVTTLWSLIVSTLYARFPAFWAHSRPFISLPIELQNTATGLLLVFRTNNGYERLAEARATLGRCLCLSRELAQTVACTWPLTPMYEEPVYDTRATNDARAGGSVAGVVGGDMAAGWLYPGAIGALPCVAALQVARYLVAFSWALKADLREPVYHKSLDFESGRSFLPPEDVLRTLLPKAEVDVLLLAPSVPIAILGRLRMLLADEHREGRLRPHLHHKLEEDLRDLNLCVADNQRLFHSPIPPTMSRHVGGDRGRADELDARFFPSHREVPEPARLTGSLVRRRVHPCPCRAQVTRCLLLWLATMPLVLSGRLPPLGVAVATAVTTYIFTGMEEIGAQVEQPFESMPLWQYAPPRRFERMVIACEHAVPCRHTTPSAPMFAQCGSMSSAWFSAGSPHVRSHAMAREDRRSAFDCECASGCAISSHMTQRRPLLVTRRVMLKASFE